MAVDPRWRMAALLALVLAVASRTEVANAGDSLATACDAGDARACTDAALQLLECEPSPTYEQARELFERGCAGLDPLGCSNAGALYHWPFAGTPDPEKAEIGYLAACKMGFEVGCENFRMFHAGVPWFIKLVDRQGNLAVEAVPKTARCPASAPCDWVVPYYEVKVDRLVKPTFPPHAPTFSMPKGRFTCRVVIDIDTEGVPTNVAVQKCPRVFHSNTTRAMRRSRWHPYKHNGEPARARFTTVVTYRRK